VSLLLEETSPADLGACEDVNDGAIFADTFELAGSGLAVVLRVFPGVHWCREQGT
jgi:hypothetical protein